MNLFFAFFLSLAFSADSRHCGDFSTAHSYKGGQSGYLRLPFQVRANGWNLELALDRNVTNLDIFEAKLITVTDNVFLFTNENWNGKQDKGTNLSLGYQAAFEGAEKPHFISIILNDNLLCMEDSKR